MRRALWALLAGGILALGAGCDELGYAGIGLDYGSFYSPFAAFGGYVYDTFVIEDTFVEQETFVEEETFFYDDGGFFDTWSFWP